MSGGVIAPLQIASGLYCPCANDAPETRFRQSWTDARLFNYCFSAPFALYVHLKFHRALTPRCYGELEFSERAMSNIVLNDGAAENRIAVASAPSQTTAAFLPAYILIAALFAAALADSSLNGGALQASLQITGDLVFILVQFAVPVMAAILLISSYRAAGRDEMVSHAASRLRQTVFSWHVAHRVLPLVSFVVFLASFVHFKMRIPDIGGFRWDDDLYALDRMIFGGMSAWEFLAPVYDMPSLVSALDKLYSLWIPGIFVFWCWVAYDKRLPMALRQQYLVATVATWGLGGIVLGTLMGSVGPCFYGMIHTGQPDLFAGLVQKLAAINASHTLVALPVQQQLFDAYLHPGVDVVGGISAMPSMHNAQAAIFVLTALRINKWLALAMGLFGAVIVSGSVILGWHYASDSLAGLLIALVVWRVSGYLLGRFSPAH
jgi:PAP2 superfamily